MSGGRFSRVPLRVRLVAGFAAAMVVVLAAAGTFVYWRVQVALDARLDDDLATAASTLAPTVNARGRLDRPPELLSPSEGYQVLDARGDVLSHDPALGAAPVLDPATVAAARDHPVTRDVGALLPASQRPLRLYATALPAGSGPGGVLVVAVRRDQRDEALRELLGQLLAAGLGALVVTAAVGDRLARASLRPVERYRAQATDIAAGATGVRLDVPPGRDDEITRLGHTLNSMLAALEAALDHERRFVQDASHELRTPLTLLRTRAQLARRRPRSPEQYQAVLAEVETDVEHLARLADQLLGLGTPGTEASAPADLARVVRDTAERRRTLVAPEHSFAAPDALRVETAASLVVRAPQRALEQLLDNLLDNAALHGRPPVSVTVEQVHAHARLVVSDSGDGMDAETLATAPQRFTRSSEARSRPGAGLGLSLVASTVEAAGGELRLCSAGRHCSFGSTVGTPCEHGPGMTVTVLLPLEGAVAS